MEEKTPKNYQRERLNWAIASYILEMGVLALFVLTYLSAILRSLLDKLFAGHLIPVFIGYVAIIVLSHLVLFFPLSFKRGYLLEHKYGMSNQTFGAWLRDYLKMTAVGWFSGFIAVSVVFYLLRRNPAGWWWQSALVLWVGYIFLVHLTPVLILPLFFKFKRLEDREILDRISKVSEAAGVRIGRIYEFNMSRMTRSANAAVTGLGSTRRILLADNLLCNFTPDEVATIAAHEIAHHKCRHMGKIITMNLILLFILLYGGHIIINSSSTAFGLRGPQDVASLPLLAFVLGMGSLFFLPIVNSLLRMFESEADRLSLIWCGNPEAFISMMQKITSENLADPSPNPVVELIFHSHPSAQKRIALALSFKECHPETQGDKEG